jgi:hypothetical protein
MNNLLLRFVGYLTVEFKALAADLSKTDPLTGAVDLVS